MQFSFLLTVLAFVAHLAYAIPYACLLAGVNTQDNPADLPAVCGKGATTVQRYLASNCGGNVNDAQKAFIATCSAAGTSVGKSSVSRRTATRNSILHTNPVSFYSRLHCFIDQLWFVIRRDDNVPKFYQLRQLERLRHLYRLGWFYHCWRTNVWVDCYLLCRVSYQHRCC